MEKADDTEETVHFIWNNLVLASNKKKRKRMIQIKRKKLDTHAHLYTQESVDHFL